MSMNSNPTQVQRIVDYIKKHGGITSLDATRDLGIIRLASRISEMKEDGYKIESQWVKVKNRYGETNRVKRYSLKGDANG